MKGPRRLTIDLSPAAWDRLDRLKELTEAGTKTGVIQQALQLLEFAVDAGQRGHVMLDKAPDGNVERLAILGISAGGKAVRP